LFCAAFSRNNERMIERAKQIIGGIIALGILAVVVYLAAILIIPSGYTGAASEPFRMNPIIAYENETIFGIGDIGPAGGIVFYDRGHRADGWRFLEAAPAHLTFTADWGALVRTGGGFPNFSYSNVQGTSEGIGAGRRNTELIIEHTRNMRWSSLTAGPAHIYGAARLIAGIEHNGFNDWFLPSKDELNLMYENLALQGLGNFGSPIPQGTSGYWSSSQRSWDRAWVLFFNTGSHLDSTKTNEYRVRAARAF